MSETFSVVVTGKIADGFALSDAKSQVSKLFKLSPEKVERLFSGKPVAIRRGIDKPQAMKLRAALAKTGVIAVIKASSPEQRPAAAKPEARAEKTTTARAKEAPEKAVTSDQQTIVCPRCGHEQDFTRACGMCKMDLSLHIDRLQRKERARVIREKARAAG